MKRAISALLATLALLVFAGFTPRRILIDERFVISGPPLAVLSQLHQQLLLQGAKPLTSPSPDPQLYELPSSRTRIAVSLTEDELRLSGASMLAPGCSQPKTERKIRDLIDTVIDDTNRAGAPMIFIEKKKEPNKAMEPTPVAVTNRAFPHFVRARFAPSTSAAHLQR